jgi:hypothetical protein
LQSLCVGGGAKNGTGGEGEGGEREIEGEVGAGEGEGELVVGLKNLFGSRKRWSQHGPE